MCSQVGKVNYGITFNDNDFVSIYDGPNDQFTRIEKLNGYKSGFNILSTRNSLFVILESDEIYEENEKDLGFLATIHHSNP